MENTCVNTYFCQTVRISFFKESKIDILNLIDAGWIAKAYGNF